MPEPVQSSTRTGTMLTPFATPYVVPPTVPATCVPWPLQSVGVGVVVDEVVAAAPARPPKSLCVDADAGIDDVRRHADARVRVAVRCRAADRAALVDAVEAPTRRGRLDAGRVIDRHGAVRLDREHRGVPRQQRRDGGRQRDREALQCVLVDVAETTAVCGRQAHRRASRQLGVAAGRAEPVGGRAARASPAAPLRPAGSGRCSHRTPAVLPRLRDSPTRRSAGRLRSQGRQARPRDATRSICSEPRHHLPNGHQPKPTRRFPGLCRQKFV